MSEVKPFYAGPVTNDMSHDHNYSLCVYAEDFDAMKRQYAKLEARYSFLRTVTPYKFKKMQEASTTDGGDVLYFHADKFDAQIDATLSKETESENHE